MTPPDPAAGWDAERLAVVIQHAIYCSPYDALCAAKEVVSAFPRPTATSAEAMPQALALIERLVGADLVELCDKEGDIAADARAFLARVRGAGKGKRHDCRASGWRHDRSDPNRRDP